MVVAKEAQVLIPISQAVDLIDLVLSKCTATSWLHKLAVYIKLNLNHMANAFRSVGAGCQCQAHNMQDLNQFNNVNQWVKAHPEVFTTNSSHLLSSLEMERFALCTLTHAAKAIFNAIPCYPDEIQTFDPRTVPWVPEVLRQHLQPSKVRVGALIAFLSAFELKEQYQDVVDGFTHGFRVGYEPERSSQYVTSRIPEEPELQTFMRDHLKAESRTDGRILGPFPYDPQKPPSWLK